MKRVVLGHGHQESKDFLLGFSRNCVGISLPSEAGEWGDQDQGSDCVVVFQL